LFLNLFINIIELKVDRNSIASKIRIRSATLQMPQLKGTSFTKLN